MLLKAVEFITMIVMSIGGELGAEEYKYHYYEI